MQERAEVVVVGGGPGGSTAATLIARAGHDVVLIERDEHPRHQIGESLLPSTVHGVCDLLGVRDALHEAGFVRKRGGTFRWGAQSEPWTFAFSSVSPDGADYAFQVERARFDHLLIEHARASGVKVFENTEVMQALQDDSGRVVGVLVTGPDGSAREIRADQVIDASGHGSRLARLAGRRVHSEFFRNVAVYGYYEGALRQAAPNAGNIITSAFEHGWCWFIPLSDGLTSVGAVIDHRHAGAIRDDREAALTKFVEECPIINEKLVPARRVTEGMYGEVRVRKDWSYSNESTTAPGLHLVGDSACFIDPVFSSGVHLATYSGMLAARSVNTILAGAVDEERCQEEFRRRYEEEFRLFYEFLVAFYDMGRDWDNYYWTARRLLNTEEQANEAFIRLIAGGAASPEDFFRERADAGDAFADVVAFTAETESGAMSPAAPSGEVTADDIRRRQAVMSTVTSGLARMHVGTSDPDGAHDAPDALVTSDDGLTWLLASPV